VAAKINQPNADANPDLTITIVRDFDARAELVYDAWLDPQAVGQWLFATPDGVMQRVEVDPIVGGKFIIAEQRGETLAEHVGEYLELDRPRKIVFSFIAGGGATATRVSVDIEPTADGSRLTLSHQIAPEWAHYLGRAREGWATLLDGLDTVLAADRTVVSRRDVHAPRELVFQATADPQRFARWWGPAGFTNTVHDFDLQPGGMLRYTMHGPDGANYEMERLVVEVVAPARVVLDNPDPAHRFLMTQTFADRGEKTFVTWRMRFDSAEEYGRVRQFIEPANEQNFDRLAAEVGRMQAEAADGAAATGEREITVTRVFNAPRELVFDAFTKPEHVAQWWGPSGFTLTTERMEVRPGGVWKFVMHGPDGTDYPNKNTYEEVVPPERLVFTHGGSKPGEPSVDFRAFISFVEIGGKTEVTMRSVFRSGEHRDQVIRDYNAVEGGRQTFARLAEFIEKG
jgi:uncharacterized protein YndB with AHSA1/START domain